MAYPGLCVLPSSQLPSQPGPDACHKDSCVQHGISCEGRGGGITSESFELSDVSCDALRKEGLYVGFPDLARAASKESFSRESSRSSFWSSYSSTLSVVSEDKTWECSVHEEQYQDERSSLSSLSSSDESSSYSGEEVTELQSPYEGPLDNMFLLKEALPSKRGLSSFFTGKSRSFSCLSDVASVEDLAKADTPYPKKRKYFSSCIGNADRCMQTGAFGIPKKGSHGKKHAKVISGASDAIERYQDGHFKCPSKSKKTPRSYSLCDLHCAESQCSRE